RTEADVIVDPVRRTGVLMQSWYVPADPDADVRERIKIPGQRIWFVRIDGRCPINGHATEDEAKKDWHGQPVAAPHQEVVPANDKHAGLILRHACSDHLVKMSGQGHTYSPR